MTSAILLVDLERHQPVAVLIAELLTHVGTDPNWRRRPSVLVQ
jgi:hypothetical protein